MTLKRKLKNSWKSLTIWFNGLALSALPLFEMFKDSLPSLGLYLDNDVYKYVGAAVVVGNIILRFKTDKGLHEK